MRRPRPKRARGRSSRIAGAKDGAQSQRNGVEGARIAGVDVSVRSQAVAGVAASAGGFKFRHQHPVGGCVLDFSCAAVRLNVEVDGDSHDMGDNPDRDARRDRWLRRRRVTIVRFN
ncbi:MAG TPA: DUF559 domain-containing protein, partial [Allosphingosinicella sp.]|nr:DUF559 domain-containing protein [Allosphingosinicella sp.]